MFIYSKIFVGFNYSNEPAGGVVNRHLATSRTGKIVAVFFVVRQRAVYTHEGKKRTVVAFSVQEVKGHIRMIRCPFVHCAC